jgi:PilZ domain
LDDPPQFEKRRQDRRVHMRVPVQVRADGPDGHPLEEETHTGVVGVLGAMVRMSRQLKIGSELDLTNRFSQSTARFRVVWVNAPEDGDLWEIGIESLEPLGDFWGVRFPPRPDAP